jgi:hypothetical protein
MTWRMRSAGTPKKSRMARSTTDALEAPSQS